MKLDQHYPPALPRNFVRWNGPWAIGLVCWIAGDETLGKTVLVERDVWVRSYLERSGCDTPGCCEWEWSIFGPFMSGIRVVEDV